MHFSRGTCKILALVFIFVSASCTRAQLFQLGNEEKKVLEEKTFHHGSGAAKRGPKQYSGADAMVLPSECDLFAVRPLQHVVSSFLEKMNVTAKSFDSGQSISVTLEAELSHEDLQALENFLKDPATALQELDHVKVILTTFLRRPEPQSYDLGTIFWTFCHQLSHALGVVFSIRAVIYVLVCSVFAILVSLLTWRMVVSREIGAVLKNGVLLLLVIGVAWEYYALVEKSRARNAALLEQLPEMPPECDYDRLNAWETAKYHFRQIAGIEDPCVQYFRLNAVDPVLEVSPASALIKTCGKWGSQFSSSFNNIVPFWFRPILAIIVAFMMPFLFFLGVFNYKVRTPLISVEPANSSASNPAVDLLVGENGLLSALKSSNGGPGSVTSGANEAKARAGRGDEEEQEAIEDKSLPETRLLSEPDSGEVSEVSSSETEPEEEDIEEVDLVDLVASAS